MPLVSFSWSELFPGIQSWEFIGFITGILSVFLLIPVDHPKLQWTNWIFSVISATVYFYLFKEWTLYGNMALQVPFVILSVLGALVWIGQLVKGWDIQSLRKIKEIPTKYCSLNHWVIALLLALIAEIPAYYILDYYGDASPLWDGFIFTISIAAIYLQLRKYVQSWYLWILVDVIAVPFHLSQDRGATAVLYATYLMMCIAGVKAWRGDVEREMTLQDEWMLRG